MTSGHVERNWSGAHSHLTRLSQSARLHRLSRESTPAWASLCRAFSRDDLLGFMLLFRLSSDEKLFLYLYGISPFAQSISTILNFKQRMDSFFRDKSKICVLERSNEAILICKLGLKYTRFVNTMKVGMFWTKHLLQPHEISISITNVYSIG